MNQNNIKKIIIGVVVLLCIIPLMKYGYMIGLDFVSDTWGTLPTSTFHTFFIYNFPNYLFHQIGIPSWILEKLFIIMIYGFIGVYAYKLVKTNNIYADIFGILLLLLNPFIYGRFLDGQINVVLMYTFMLPLIYHTFVYLDDKKIKDAIWIGVYTLLLMLSSAHTIFMIIGSQAIIWIVYTLYNKVDIKKIGLSLYKMILICLLFNTVWILPLLSGQNKTTQFVQEQIDDDHIQAFTTKSGDIGLYSNVLAMRGYRGEEQYRFVSHQPISIIRHIVFMTIMILVVCGMIKSIRSSSYKGYKSISLLSIFVMAYILGLGVSGDNLFAHISEWLYDHIPFYIGLREPQKWILFLPIVYAYFGSIGAKSILDRFQNKKIDTDMVRYIGIVLAVLPILYMPKMLWGYAGQIDITDYPSSRYDQRSNFDNIGVSNDCIDLDKLERNKAGYCYNLLVLPRHGYMRRAWTMKVAPGIVANFISKYALISDTVEMRNIYSQSTSYESRVIEDWIGTVDDPDLIITDDNILDMLQGMGINHILVSKSSDYNTYLSRLETLEDNLDKIFEDETIMIYKIR